MIEKLRWQIRYVPMIRDGVELKQRVKVLQFYDGSVWVDVEEVDEIPF